LQTNTWFANKEPWKDLSKSSNEDGMSQRLRMTIGLSAECLRISGIFLQPYMPGKAAHLLDQLGVDEDKRTWDYALLGADTEYGTSKTPIGKGLENVLFPPIVMD
jgi:methionyl-tRNA synthetase